MCAGYNLSNSCRMISIALSAPCVASRTYLLRTADVSIWDLKDMRAFGEAHFRPYSVRARLGLEDIFPGVEVRFAGKHALVIISQKSL